MAIYRAFTSGRHFRAFIIIAVGRLTSRLISGTQLTPAGSHFTDNWREEMVERGSSRDANGRGTRARVNDVTELSARYENSPSGEIFTQEVRLKICYRPDFRGRVSFEPPARERRRLAHVDAIRVTACVSAAARTWMAAQENSELISHDLH